MKNVIAKNVEDKRTEYKLTCGKGTERARDCDGEIFKITAYVIFEDEKENTILTFTDGERIISTNSKTAIASFMDIITIFELDEIEIQIVTGKTKTDRTFVDVLLV